MTRAEAREVNTHRLSSPRSLRRVAEALIGSPGATADDWKKAELLNAQAKTLETIRTLGRVKC